MFHYERHNEKNQQPNVELTVAVRKIVSHETYFFFTEGTNASKALNLYSAHPHFETE